MSRPSHRAQHISYGNIVIITSMSRPSRQAQHVSYGNIIVIITNMSRPSHRAQPITSGTHHIMAPAHHGPTRYTPTHDGPFVQHISYGNIIVIITNMSETRYTPTHDGPTIPPAPLPQNVSRDLTQGQHNSYGNIIVIITNMAETSCKGPSVTY